MRVNAGGMGWHGPSHPAGDVLAEKNPAAVHETALSAPKRVEWVFLDQHAVHERIRLEYFCAFAETFVCAAAQGPVEGGEARQGGDSFFSTSEPQGNDKIRPSALWTTAGTAQSEFLRAQSQEKSEPRRIAPAEKAKIPDLPGALVGPIPSALRPLVAVCEGELRRWGWRFWYGGLAKTKNNKHKTPRQPPTAVRQWPRLALEGIILRLDSIDELRRMTEEILAVGLTGPDASPRRIIPSSILRFFISRSCRGAIMFGDLLSPDAVRQLVRDLSCVREYYICAHGRPSIIELLPL
ncbi:unnamed protein product [Phytomonas sp. Hart1]|nr:unnamed protein product [Phytomonas sp. Hart1]|eukprot:CCW70782.1 unnamed protein product [Phytomonas sp. isolate Hart1]